MRFLKAAALAAVLAFTAVPGLVVVPALAQEVVAVAPDTVVTVPYGDWSQWLLLWLANPQSIVWTIVGGIIAWLLAKLPGPLQLAFRTFRVEQMLMRAIQYGLNTTAGAAKGRTLSVDVGNEVVKKAADYAIESGTKGLNDFVGGQLGWQKKVIARIDLEADTTVTNPKAPLPLRKVAYEDRPREAGK